MQIKYNKPSQMFGGYWNAADVSARLGETVEVSETTANRLLDTGCWIVVESTHDNKALDEPPEHRMIDEDDVKKKFWSARDKRKRGGR